MSATPRLFVPTDLMAEGPVALDDAQARYLFKVLRLGVGDTVRLFNGRDGEWRAIIEDMMGKSTGLLRVKSRLREQGLLYDLHLLFAPLKKARTDFLVEKATELGVEVLEPVITEFTQTKTVRVDRLAKLALEAAEQTERMNTPRVMAAQDLVTALSQIGSGRTLYFCDERGDDPDADWGGEENKARPMADVLREASPGSASILIGPEGGFSPRERDLLRKSEGVVPVSLGPRILRAETAAVAALTLYQAIRGDWVSEVSDD